MISYNTPDIADMVRELQAEGGPVLDCGQVCLYLTEHIKRFGEYSTHELGITPDDYDAGLDVYFRSSVTMTRQQCDGRTGWGHTGQLPQNLVSLPIPRLEGQ